MIKSKNIFLLITINLLLILVPLSSANSFGYNYLPKKAGGGDNYINNTYINNTYINQTIEINSTQFSSNNPLTLNITWITNLFNGLYCRLTGCSMSGNIIMNSNNLTAIRKNTYINESYGVWSNSTDIVIGYIGGL